MASETAEAIAKRMERCFAYSDWEGLWQNTRALYDQGVKDGGGTTVPIEPLPATAPPRPEPPPPPPAVPVAAKCEACGGAGERTITLQPAPGSPVPYGRPVLATCPDCGGTGGGAPAKAPEPERAPGTFTGGGETTRDAAPIPSGPPPGFLRPAPAAVAPTVNGRYALVGDAVVDKEAKAVAYRGADAATVYEALRAG